MSSVSPGAFVDDLGEVLADAVVGHAAVDRDPGLRHVGELDRVVRVRPDRVGEVLADLVGGDVERGRELDVGDVVAAEVDVHQAGDELVVRRVLVVLHALEQRVGAVADADDRDADLVLARACRWPSRCSSRWWKPWCPFDWRRRGSRAPRRASRSTRSLTLCLRRRAAALSSRRSSGGMRSTTAPAAPGIALRRRPLGVNGTPKRSARSATATSFRFDSRRATSRTSARLSEPGMRTSTLVRS